MSNHLEAIHLLEDKIKKILYKYEFLKEENQVLLQNNAKLHVLIQDKDEQLKRDNEEYKLLKIAKTIQGSNENTRETKLKINTLVREIDRCITLLNS